MCTLLLFGLHAVPAQAQHILMLGDSLTEGQGVEKQQAFPFLVEQKLKASGHAGVTVMNAGISGSTSASGLSRLKWHLRAKPNILLLALGANDGLRGLSTDAMKKNLADVIRLAHKKGIRVLLAGMQMPPNYGAEYTRRFEKTFHDLAGEFPVDFIPFLLEGVGGNPDLNLADGIHPNRKGHRIIAETVSAHVIKVLDGTR